MNARFNKTLGFTAGGVTLTLSNVNGSLSVGTKGQGTIDLGNDAYGEPQTAAAAARTIYAAIGRPRPKRCQVERLAAAIQEVMTYMTK